MTYRYLLINPNSSPHITARLAASAQTALEDGETLSAVNASGDPAVVWDAPTLALADRHAELLCSMHSADVDAVLLGISLDGSAENLRHRFPNRPVVGMTEAALFSACLRVRRVGLLTLGPSMVPLYWERVVQIGLADRVVAIEAPVAPAAFLSTSVGVDGDVLQALDAASARLQAAGAEALVLSGAVLCGYASALSDRRNMPVFDGMACAVMQARILLRCMT
jgi:allantoin racemase|tara:strand:- start:3230 stop:3898 length:669 start_codon:yes stop_codon:yes gene_type:complete